jgi:hypothetical protein
MSDAPLSRVSISFFSGISEVLVRGQERGTVPCFGFEDADIGSASRVEAAEIW